MRHENVVRRDTFTNNNGVVWEQLTYADGQVKVFEKKDGKLVEIKSEEPSSIPEIKIKDKVDYIAGRNMWLHNELQELKSALRAKEDEWIAQMLKMADKAFGEAMERLLYSLQMRKMDREGDEELFKYLRDDFLLTFVRRLKG